METETPSLQLATRCEQRSTDTDNSKAKKSLISEWVVRFALNAEKALDAKEQAVYRSMWEEGFSDLDAQRLKAAFVACLRSHTFKTIPTIGDIRQHIQRATETATGEAAELAWQQVLDIRRVYWNPDIPGPFDRAVAKLPERIRQAARAAGVWRDFESVEALHTWAKKRFIESFIAYGELEQDKFLLPDGELKNLLAEFAETKALPAPPKETFEEMRERGLRYAQKLKSDPSQQPDLKRAIRAVARELTPRPRMRSLDEQKGILREKGFLPKEDLRTGSAMMPNADLRAV